MHCAFVKHHYSSVSSRYGISPVEDLLDFRRELVKGNRDHGTSRGQARVLVRRGFALAPCASSGVTKLNLVNPTATCMQGLRCCVPMTICYQCGRDIHVYALPDINTTVIRSPSASATSIAQHLLKIREFSCDRLTSKGKIDAHVPMHHATRGFVIRPLLSASHTSYSSDPPTSPRRTSICKGDERN